MLRGGETIHRTVMHFDKQETDDERAAGEEAERRARASLDATFSAMGLCLPGREGDLSHDAREAAAGHDDDDDDDDLESSRADITTVAGIEGAAAGVPPESVRQAQAIVALEAARPRAQWSHTGTWVVDRKSSDTMDSVMIAMNVPWVFRRLAGSIEVTTVSEHSTLTRLTAADIAEAGVLQPPWSGAAAAVPAVTPGSPVNCWLMTDKTSMGVARTVWILDGCCRKRTGSDGKSILVRGWQVGAWSDAALPTAIALGESASVAAAAAASAVDPRSMEAACSVTRELLATLPAGSIVTETVLVDNLGVMIDAREILDGGRRLRSTMLVCKPGAGQVAGQRDATFIEPPSGRSVRILTNDGFVERETQASSALDKARDAIARWTAAAPGLTSTGSVGAPAASSPLATRTRSGTSDSASVASSAARAPIPPPSGAALALMTAAHVSASPAVDLSGSWVVDYGRSQEMTSVLSVLPKTFPVWRFLPDPGTRLQLHHTPWALSWQAADAAKATIAGPLRTFLDGNWRIVPVVRGAGADDSISLPFASAGATALAAAADRLRRLKTPFFPIRASQSIESGAIVIETRLLHSGEASDWVTRLVKTMKDAAASASSAPSASVYDPPAGTTVHEIITSANGDPSRLGHAITIVDSHGRSTTSILRYLVKEEAPEERLAAETLRRKHDEMQRRYEEERRRLVAASSASAESVAESHDDDGDDELPTEERSSSSAGADAGGPGSSRRGDLTRRNMEALLEAAVKDFYGDDATVELVGDKAVVSKGKEATDEDRRRQRAQWWRTVWGEVAVFITLALLAVAAAGMPGRSRLEGVLIVLCAWILYAIIIKLPCIARRGETMRDRIQRISEHGAGDGLDDAATAQMLADAAALAIRAARDRSERRQLSRNQRDDDGEDDDDADADAHDSRSDGDQPTRAGLAPARGGVRVPAAVRRRSSRNPASDRE